MARCIIDGDSGGRPEGNCEEGYGEEEYECVRGGAGACTDGL